MPDSQSNIIDGVFTLLSAIPAMLERFWLTEIAVAVALILLMGWNARRR